MKPKVTYDPEADAVYISINPNSDFWKTSEITDSVMLDWSRDGEVMGIEILSPPNEIIERFI